MELNYFAARGLNMALNITIDDLESRLKIHLDHDKLPPNTVSYFAEQREEIHEAIQQLKQLAKAADKSAWAFVITKAKEGDA